MKKNFDKLLKRPRTKDTARREYRLNPFNPYSEITMPILRGEIAFYRAIKRYDMRILQVPLEDLVQTIRLAILTYQGEDDFLLKLRHIRKELDQLFNAFGFRKRGKREFSLEVFDKNDLFVEKDHFTDKEKDFLEKLIKTYESHTAKETCEILNIKPADWRLFVKTLSLICPKKEIKNVRN